MEINPQIIDGHWEEGWALDLHTSSSTPVKDESGNILRWDNQHPPIAEGLYQLKYCNNKSKVNGIAETISDFLDKKKTQWQIDIIVPVPPSDTKRTYQPVYEIARTVGIQSDLLVDTTTLKKSELTPSLKTIDDPEERREVLKEVFNVAENAFSNKNVLLFDDIYRSGETLNAVADIVKNKGNAKCVYALTVTKTRTKR